MTDRRFTVWGTIRGQGRPRAVSKGGFATVYKPKEDKLYESQIASAYISDCGNPAPYGEVPLDLTVVCRYAIPASFSKKKRDEALSGRLLPTKKPDADNILKSVMDALNGKAYPDDKFVVNVTLIQVYSSEAESMEVTLHQIEWADPTVE